MKPTFLTVLFTFLKDILVIFNLVPIAGKILVIFNLVPIAGKILVIFYMIKKSFSEEPDLKKKTKCRIFWLTINCYSHLCRLVSTKNKGIYLEKNMRYKYIVFR
jgi:hypothetical protein